MPEIPLGTKATSHIEVTDRVAVSFLGNERARVLATPWMIAHMEITSRDAVISCLSDGEDTVGTQVNVRHLSATPMGCLVHFEAEVTRVEGRRVEFRVSAWDEHGVVGEGTHERAIINVAKFADRLDRKRVTP